MPKSRSCLWGRPELEIAVGAANFELRKADTEVAGALVEVNCATLRGESAMSTLFGHTKGAFTGAVKDRPGLLRAADDGLLFLGVGGGTGLMSRPCSCGRWRRSGSFRWAVIEKREATFRSLRAQS